MKSILPCLIIVMLLSCSGMSIRSESKADYKSYISYKSKTDYWDEREFCFLHALYIDCEAAKREGIEVSECGMVNFDREFAAMREKYAINKEYPNLFIIPDSTYTVYTGKAGLSPMNNPYVKAYAVTARIYNLGDEPINAIKVTYVLFDNFDKPIATGSIEASFSGHPYYKPVGKNQMAVIQSEKYFDDISPNNVGRIKLGVSMVR